MRGIEREGERMQITIGRGLKHFDGNLRQPEVLGRSETMKPIDQQEAAARPHHLQRRPCLGHHLQCSDMVEIKPVGPWLQGGVGGD